MDVIRYNMDYHDDCTLLHKKVEKIKNLNVANINFYNIKNDNVPDNVDVVHFNNHIVIVYILSVYLKGNVINLRSLITDVIDGNVKVLRLDNKIGGIVEIDFLKVVVVGKDDIVVNYLKDDNQVAVVFFMIDDVGHYGRRMVMNVEIYVLLHVCY